MVDLLITSFLVWLVYSYLALIAMWVMDKLELDPTQRLTYVIMELAVAPIKYPALVIRGAYRLPGLIRARNIVRHGTGYSARKQRAEAEFRWNERLGFFEKNNPGCESHNRLETAGRRLGFRYN